VGPGLEHGKETQAGINGGTYSTMESGGVFWNMTLSGGDQMSSVSINIFFNVLSTWI